MIRSAVAALVVMCICYSLLTDNKTKAQNNFTLPAEVFSLPAEVREVATESPEMVCENGVCYQQVAASPVQQSTVTYSVASAPMFTTSSRVVSSGCGGTSYPTPVRTVMSRQPVRSVIRARPVRRFVGRLFCR